MIDHAIPTSSLDRIQAAIYTILKTEFENQAYQFSNPSCAGITFWKSRTTPIDKSESGTVSISLFNGTYQNQSVGSQHGHYVFVLDFVTNAKSQTSKKGYEVSAIALEKLMMCARYILMNPIYITLGLTGIVEHTEVSRFQISKDERVGDAENNAIGQLLFEVTCEETSDPNTFPDLSESDTDVYLALTDRGYQYLTY